MTPLIPERPIARIVRLLAVALVLCTVLLLTLGGLTTSFRAGMADPVWPTEPWFLVVNGHEYFHEKYTGFLLEHTHRFAGWTAGLLATALAVGAWLSGPDKRSRLFGLLSIIALLAAYGWFHGQMMAAQKAREATGQFVFPTPSGVATAVTAGLVLLAAAAHLFSRQSGKWVRAAAAVLLIAVMTQGLLGGFRVFLDQSIGVTRTLGIELSATHGVFAQVVFSLMVLVPALAGPRTPGDTLGDSDRARLRWLALALPAAVLVQLVWAVWVRHAPTPLTQRLHFLTAFVVLGLAVWLAVRARATADGRRLLGFGTAHLLLLLGVQILLGVEAWMGKFAAAGPDALLPPELRPVTVSAGFIRTLHQLIGTMVLASSVVVAFRAWRSPLPAPPVGPTRDDRQPTASQYEPETVPS